VEFFHPPCDGGHHEADDEKHLAILRRHMVEVIEIHADLLIGQEYRLHLAL